MCGIGGLIGKSKNPKASYELLTNIFANLESRGQDAAGCWGTESDPNTGGIIYHKEPISSSKFVEKPFWTKVQKLNPNLMLIHARGASTGMGSPRINKNNHPFVSEDKRIGLIHNGVIYESEYLRKKYETKSDCDSEVLLRIYEAGLNRSTVPESVSRRLEGLRDVWSYIHKGHMAVAIGELEIDGSRSLTLFRNDKRPLWFADFRQKLGQIFFFSSTEILSKAMKECKNSALPSSVKMFQVPEKHAFLFRIDDEDEIVTQDNYRRYDINQILNQKSFDATNIIKISEPVMEMQVTSYLDDEEEVLEHPIKKPIGITQPRFPRNMVPEKLTNENLFEQKCGDDLPEFACNMEINDADDLAGTIKSLADSLVSQIANLAMESSLTKARYQEVLESMEQARCELDGTLRLLEQ